MHWRDASLPAENKPDLASLPVLLAAYSPGPQPGRGPGQYKPNKTIFVNVTRSGLSAAPLEVTTESGRFHPAAGLPLAAWELRCHASVRTLLLLAGS